MISSDTNTPTARLTSAALRLLALAAGYQLLASAHRFDWDHGLARGAVILTLLASVAINRESAARREPHAAGGGRLFAAAVAAAAAIWACGYFAYYLPKAWPGDIGRSTEIMTKYLFESGMNPYATPLDMVAPVETGLKFYNGYKYFPLTILAYAPFLAAFGSKGLFIANFLFFALGFYAVAALGNRFFGGDPASAAVAAALYAVAPFQLHELFRQAVNDGIPVSLAMLALLMLRNRREPLAGLCLGLSMSSKYMPGLILVPFMALAAQRRLRFLAWTAVPPAAIVLPFFLWAPAEFIGTIVIYYFKRSGDSTSVAYYLPSFLRTAWSVAGFLALIGLCILFERRIRKHGLPELRRRGLDETYHFCLAATAMTLFTGATHRNYLLWFMPSLAICLGDAGPNLGRALSAAAARLTKR